MVYRLLAVAVLLVHLAFILFVMFGGFVVLRRPPAAWLHLPALGWGVLIEYAGWICPLTPLENTMRERGGLAGYPGGFIEHYLTAVIYPAGLTRNVQIVLGSLVLLFNVGVYRCLVRRRRSSGGS